VGKAGHTRQNIDGRTEDENGLNKEMKAGKGGRRERKGR
jgi:hypothetical protein